MDTTTDKPLPVADWTPSFRLQLMTIDDDGYHVPRANPAGDVR